MSRSQRFSPAKAPGILRRPVSPVNPLLLLAGLVLLFGIVVAGGFYLLTAKPVTLIIDGIAHDTRTHQGTVGALLHEVGLLLDPQDTVSPGVDTQIRNGLTVTIGRAQIVLIDMNGQTKFVHTRQTDPRGILNDAAITLSAHDKIMVDGGPLKTTPYTTVPTVIQITRAINITIIDNGKSSTIQTTGGTVAEALQDSTLVGSLYLADEVTPALSTAVHDGDTITIHRSVPVTITADGRTINTRTHGQTVDAVLGEVGVALVGLDRSTPDGTTQVTSGMSIRVVRVTEDDEIQRSDIDFNQVSQTDPTLPLDTKQVIQSGIKGIREVRTRIRREDGVEISRSAPQTVIVQQPRDQITAIGTLPQIKTLDTPDGTIQYWRVLHVTANSYMPASSGKSADDPTYGLTATGKQLHKGMVAVDPQLIPLGTALYVPGYGRAVAEDTGGAVKGLVIDLGYSDTDYQNWHTDIDIYLLVPAPDQIPLLPTTAAQ